MGFRFRKKIKLFPGVSLNLSKSGVSASIGKPGATLNIGGAHGSRVTVGIPGTGISYSEKMSESTDHRVSGPAPASGSNSTSILALLIAGVLMALFVLLVMWLAG